MTRLSVGLALVFLAAWTAAPRVADAKCAGPRATYAPSSGSAVPTNPTIYYFVPSWARTPRVEVAATLDGASVPVTLKLVSSTKAFNTYRLVVKTKRAGKLTIKPVGDYATTASFTVDPAWTPPADRHVRILSKKHVEDQWTCSHTNAHFFDLTPAPAYRVRWAKDQRAFDRGDVTTVVFPFRTDDFWGHSAKATNGRVGLGHLNCFDKTAPEDLDGDKLVVRVSGLYPDGEEYVKPPARPRRRMRCGTAWVFSRRAAVAPSPRYTARQWQWLGLLGFALLGFFAARRRLRGVTRENSWRLRAVQDARLPHILATVYAVCSTLLAVGLTAASAGTTTFAVAGVVVLASTVTGAAVAVALADR